MRGEGLIRKPSPCVGPTTKSWHKSENHNFKIQLSGLTKSGPVRAYVPEFREDLARMNEGKVGRPYEYSDALVFWLLTAMTLFNSDYRCAVGFFGPVLRYMGVRVPSYTRFLERCHALAEEHLLEDGCDVKRRYGDGVLSVYVSPYVTDRVRRVGVDSSGLSLSCPNRWRGRKWKGAFSPRMAENTKDPGGIEVLRPFPGPRKNKDQKFKRGVPNPRIRWMCRTHSTYSERPSVRRGVMREVSNC